jgi:hypothetical protein
MPVWHERAYDAATCTTLRSLLVPCCSKSALRKMGRNGRQDQERRRSGDDIDLDRNTDAQSS